MRKAGEGREKARKVGRKEGRTVKEEKKMKHGGCRMEQEGRKVKERRKEGKRMKEGRWRKGRR